MRRSGFIFDLDGTLFDSEMQIFRALNDCRVETGNLPLSKESLKKLIGLPGKALFGDLVLPPNDIEQILNRFRELLRIEILKENAMYENSAKFVELISQKAFKIGIATSKPTSLAKHVIDNSVISPFVDHVQGTDDFLPKPDPTVILKCMYSLKLEYAIMFGDRVEDMEAAMAAGVIGIGVAQSIHSKEELFDAGATIVFSNFTEIIENSIDLIEMVEG